MAKSILFVDLSELFLPLVRELAEQGFLPILLGATTQLAMEQGIPCCDFLAFNDSTTKAKVQQETIRVAENLNRLMQSPEIREVFASSQGSFLPHTGKHFFNRFLELASGQLTVLECFEAIRRQHDVVLMVFRTEKAPYERALISRAAQFGIPTLHAAHAIWRKPTVRVAGEYNLGLSSDYVSVFGERAKQGMIEIGVAPERIFTTGSPYWDNLYAPQHQLSREAACEAIGLNPHHPVLLFCTGYPSPNSAHYSSIVRQLLNVHRAVVRALTTADPGLQLVVRPHPSELGRIPGSEKGGLELLESYRRWLAAQGLTNVQLALDNKIQAMRAADVVLVWGDSGIITESMILRRPVIGIHAGQIYSERDGIIIVNELEQLPQILRTFLEDPAKREEIVKNQSKALSEINYGNDGRALERLTELVLKLARNPRAPERVRKDSIEPLPNPDGLNEAPSIDEKTTPWPISAPDNAQGQDFSDSRRTGLIPTRRAVVDINRACNARCLMCYYAFDQTRGEKPFEEVKAELLAVKARGNTSVDFTGGEPTIYPRMAEVIRFAEAIGLHTCIITNGLALERIKGLVAAGCREWLVSIHGFEGGHDRILGVNGAWQKVNRTAAYLSEHDCLVRVNCTLTRHNARDLPRLAKHYLDAVNPKIINFINFNPHYQWGDQAKADVYRRLNQVQIKVSQVAPYLKEAIEILRQRHLWVNVRYFPFCQLKGYETHICNNPQVMFDSYEWDYGVSPKTVAAHLAFAGRLQEKIGHSQGACAQCGVLKVCGGIHKNYARLYGDTELFPYAEQSDYPYYFKNDIEADILIPAFQPNVNLSRVLHDISATAFPPYHLILTSRHQSASRNRNRGLERSQSPYIIMCDDDVVRFPAGWNRTLINILKEDREILAVSARLMRPNGEPGANSANNYDLSRPLVDVPMIPTACCAFRRPTVRFDERYLRAGWEDTDFFMQMKEQYGGKLVIANDVQVVHLNEEKNEGGAQNAENMRLFFAKWGHKFKPSENTSHEQPR